jgi:hypothetical protein
VSKGRAGRPAPSHSLYSVGVKVYKHRLNREDVATGTILIEKRAWAWFPKPMVEFAVDAGGARFATRIVAEDCACRLPVHQHLHLEAGHFRDRLAFSAGRTIEIVAGHGSYIVRSVRGSESKTVPSSPRRVRAETSASPKKPSGRRIRG